MVIGVVFEISGSRKHKPDRKEGLGSSYEEKTIELIAQSGETINASTYYATNIDPYIKPYKWYKHHVLTGAQENGLPNTYVTQIESIESIDDPDPERHESEMTIYANR